MWRPSDISENTWTRENGLLLIKEMKKPEYFFQTLLFIKSTDLKGSKYLCNIYTDLFVVPSSESHCISISEEDIGKDSNRDSYWESTYEVQTSSTQKKEISIIERKDPSDNNFQRCSLGEGISVINIHVTWFRKGKNLSHSNLLIFDHDKKNIYLFDPYGAVSESFLKPIEYSHDAIDKYIKEWFPMYKYLGNIHKLAQKGGFLETDKGPQIIQEDFSAPCHRDVMCQGWSSYFLLKMISIEKANPLLSYIEMVNDVHNSNLLEPLKPTKKNGVVTEVVGTMLDIAKNILRVSNELLFIQGIEDIENCKKMCILDVMTTYLDFSVPFNSLPSIPDFS